jgi:hypothetical protein
MPYRIIGLILLLLTASSCSSIKKYTINEEFEVSSKSYNKMLRWREWEKATAAFVAEPQRAKFASRVKAAEKITVTELRIRTQECNVDKGEAEVVIDIDYYISPSVTIKSVEDYQKWKYIEENGQKLWRLTTLFPEFK